MVGDPGQIRNDLRGFIAGRATAHPALERDVRATMAPLIGTDLEQSKAHHTLKSNPVKRGKGQPQLRRSGRQHDNRIVLSRNQQTDAFQYLQVPLLFLPRNQHFGRRDWVASMGWDVVKNSRPGARPARKGSG